MRLEYFQMIDRVETLDRGANTLVAHSVVPEASPIFEGHFPGYPIMPGVLLIETMAQASGYLLLALNQMARMPFFAGVKRGKLRSFVPPRAELEVTARLVHEGSGFAVTEAEIAVGGKKTCDAELTFTLAPFPAPELEAAMRAQIERIGLFAAATP